MQSSVGWHGWVDMGRTGRGIRVHWAIITAAVVHGSLSRLHLRWIVSSLSRDDIVGQLSERVRIDRQLSRHVVEEGMLHKRRCIQRFLALFLGFWAWLAIACLYRVLAQREGAIELKREKHKRNESGSTIPSTLYTVRKPVEDKYAGLPYKSMFTET